MLYFAERRCPCRRTAQGKREPGATPGQSRCCKRPETVLSIFSHCPAGREGEYGGPSQKTCLRSAMPRPRGRSAPQPNGIERNILLRPAVVDPRSMRFAVAGGPPGGGRGPPPGAPTQTQETKKKQQEINPKILRFGRRRALPPGRRFPAPPPPGGGPGPPTRAEQTKRLEPNSYDNGLHANFHHQA